MTAPRPEGWHVHRGDSVRGAASHGAGEGHAGQDDHAVDENEAGDSSR